MGPRAKAILTLDAGAAAVAGIVMLLCAAWLSRVYGLPLSLVRLLGTANLAYAAYSGSLAFRAWRRQALSRRSVDVLILGNLAWSLACGVMVHRTWPAVHGLGVAHLVGEGLFVACLAVLELRVVRPESR